MTDAIQGIVVGSANVAGVTFGDWRNLIFSGQIGAPANHWSTNAFLIYNSQHLYTDQLMSFYVNSGLHLVSQGSATLGFTLANNTFKDTYVYCNRHSAALGNNKTAGIWDENYDRNTQGGNLFIGQTQVNDYFGDGTGYHMIIEGNAGRNGGTAEGFIFDYLDLEGSQALCAIFADRLTNSKITIEGAGYNAKGPGASWCGTGTGLNVITGYNSTTISDTGPNTYEGYLGTPNLPGVYIYGPGGNIVDGSFYNLTVQNIATSKTIQATSLFYARGQAGVTATKALGNCTVTITGGIITGVTGC